MSQFVRRLRAGEFTAGKPVAQFVLLLQEATRHDASVPAPVGRGLPVPRRIGSHHGMAARDVADLAADGLAVLYAPSMRNGDGLTMAEDRGNAIVSTLPLRQPRLIELPLEHQRRVAVMAALDGRTTTGTPWHLELVDVHLDTALALMHGGPFAARRRQAAALVDALQEFPDDRSGSRVVVVAGDFNTWRGRREPAVTLVLNALRAAPAKDIGPTWTGPLGLHATLDHVFVRGSRTLPVTTRLPIRFGSDHYPLLTIIGF